MLHRVLYTIVHCWKFRAALSQFIQQDSLKAATIFDIDMPAMQAQGVRGLIVDFDGVLNAHGANYPTQAAIDCIKNWVQLLGLHKVFILSNKPMQVRADFFATELPETEFIIGKRKKPYPDGVELILATSKLNPNELLLIDDRLATGILAAMITGTKAILIDKPMINLQQNFWTESFFVGLRWFERCCFSLCMLKKHLHE